MSEEYRPTRVYDHPDAAEIVRRVARFLDEEVYGAVLDHKVDYRVRVAANLLRLVEREIGLTAGETDRSGRVTTHELVVRFGGVEELAAQLASGERSIVDPEVFEVLRAYVRLKADVAEIRRAPNPRPQSSEERS